MKKREINIFRAHNPEATGSNPVPATKNNYRGLEEILSPFFLYAQFNLEIRGIYNGSHGSFCSYQINDAVIGKGFKGSG